MKQSKSCKRYLKDEQEAEDVLVDAFYQLNKSLHGFNYINDLAYYAYTNRIVVHECLKRLKKQLCFSFPTVTQKISKPMIMYWIP